MDKRIRDYKKCFERHGCEVVSIVTSAHLHIVAKHGDQERRFIASISPSDGRAMRNFEGNVRRWVKELHHERPEETTR
jgi:hypothetical protein